MSSEQPPPLADDIAISVRNLSKSYRLFDHPGDRIKQFLTCGFKQYNRAFTALENISFDIRKGETVGIIGRNGSGKSTLLQLICGILRPTKGSIQVNGRISALLELGAGFNPEFTGRENIYFQGVLMGFTQAQMDERYDDIASFADIGEFIDQPVRTYSSGMFVRLAFSVAIHVSPEILVVDEALGVGDAEFQERSFSRMREMQKSGMTILFVSHAITAVRNFCQRAIWLDSGSILNDDAAATVCYVYLSRLTNHIGAPKKPTRNLYSSTQGNHHSGHQKLISLARVEADKRLIHVGENITLQFELHFSDKFNLNTEFGLGVIIRNESGKLVTLVTTIRDDLALSGSVSNLSLELTNTAFVPGRYWVSVNVCDRDVLFPYDDHDNCLLFEVVNETNCKGIPRWEGELACLHTWLCSPPPAQ